MRRSAKGITLIALVLTILFLLILSTISIQALTNTGIFESASEAKLETKRGQIKDWLGLKLVEVQSENYNKTEEEIIELTRQNVEKNKSQLEKMGKNINIDFEISTEEDGEQVKPYFYIVVDKDIYKVSIEEQKFIGEDGKLLPVIKLVSISNTSNSITVNVKTSRNEGGKLKYYIKENDASDYTLVKELEEETYTYEGLKQGIKNSVKIVAENANKLTSEVTGEQTIEIESVYLYDYGTINTDLVGGISQYYFDSYYKGGTFGFATNYYYSGEIGTGSYNCCCAKFDKAIDFTNFSKLKITCQLTNVSASSSYPDFGFVRLSEYGDYDIRGSHNSCINNDVFENVTSDTSIQTFEIDISDVKGEYYLYTSGWSGAFSSHTALLRVYQIELL